MTGRVFERRKKTVCENCANRWLGEQDYFNSPCCRCNEDDNEFVHELFGYDPMRDGVVTECHIWLKNGHQPMANLKFAFGGSTTIRWDTAVERNKFMVGINAYTIFFDDRAKAIEEAHPKIKCSGNMIEIPIGEIKEVIR